MIEIINYERVNEGKKIGYVDIYLPARKEYICHIPHFQNAEKKWFNLPSYGKTMPDGSKKYFPIWKLDPDLHNSQLLEALHEPVKEFCLKNKIPEIEPLNLAIGISDDQCPF